MNVDVVYSFLVCLSLILLTVLLSLISYYCTSQAIPASQSDGFDSNVNIVVTDRSNQRTVVTVEQCPDNQTSVCRNPKLLCSSKVKFSNKSSSGSSSSSSSCCSICLMDYKESDLLRVLPDCGHFFHAKCVDPWFNMHLTCPICRMPLV